MFKPPVIAAIGGEVPVPMATTPVPVAIAVAPSWTKVIVLVTRVGGCVDVI